MSRHFLEEFLDLQFFGEFLIDRWVINREQLLAALEHQMSRNERFGEVAVKKGFLTQERATEINRRQKSSDRTFGESALEMGFLSTEQVEEIVRFQRNNNLFLGETLLRLGSVTQEVLDREVANFREHQKRFLANKVGLPVSGSASEILSAAVEVTKKMFRRAAGVPFKAGRGFLVGADDVTPKEGYFLTVGISFIGDDFLRFLLSVSKPVALPIAGTILGENIEQESPEMIADAVKEFCNYVCGNAAAKVGRKGIAVNITPPQDYQTIPFAPEGFQTVAFPVRSTVGGIDLRFHTRCGEGSEADPS